ncbi:MAG: phosphoglucosamine mutase [Elsteraceae bacterium]
MSAKSLFGTDGIRGRANSEPMTASTALRVAQAAGYLCLKNPSIGGDQRRRRAVIGKDTRLSGYMLEPALTAGLISVGIDVMLVGPLPTPAIAMLTRSLRADLGVMLSASHNPYQDNGVKLFGADGYKLSDDIEREISGLVQGEAPIPTAAPADLGRARRLEDAPGRYVEFVKAAFPKGKTLDGLKVVVDCANGSAYKVAPAVLRELGAEVVALAVSPNGMNINAECGATHPAALAAAVVAEGADIGIALDGDADRLILVDERGTIVDGDQILALIASNMAEAQTLTGGGIVATVMSNLGLERYLAGRGIDLTRTKVGDRYVVEEMRRAGRNVGGEQSGHVVLSDVATTGDGLAASLQVLAALIAQDGPASELLRCFTPLPQVLRNVRLQSGSDPMTAPSVVKAMADAEARLKGVGRLLIRKSGTEPLIRVMAEAEDTTLVNLIVDGLVDEITRAAR